MERFVIIVNGYGLDVAAVPDPLLVSASKSSDKTSSEAQSNFPSGQSSILSTKEVSSQDTLHKKMDTKLPARKDKQQNPGSYSGKKSETLTYSSSERIGKKFEIKK